MPQRPIRRENVFLSQIGPFECAFIIKRTGLLNGMVADSPAAGQEGLGDVQGCVRSPVGVKLD